MNRIISRKLKMQEIASDSEVSKHFHRQFFLHLTVRELLLLVNQIICEHSIHKVKCLISKNANYDLCAKNSKLHRI